MPAKLHVLEHDIATTTKDGVEYISITDIARFKSAERTGFTLTAGDWIEKTNAIGIISQCGRYGGTFVQKDIAFEFSGLHRVEGDQDE